MTIDIKAIRARAQKATPGEWLAESATVYALNERGTNLFSCHMQGGWQHGYRDAKDDKHTTPEGLAANAAFIAGMSPDQTLALCSRIEELEAALMNIAVAWPQVEIYRGDEPVMTTQLARVCEIASKALESKSNG